jgi:hypothetical protein
MAFLMLGLCSRASRRVWDKGQEIFGKLTIVTGFGWNSV